MNTVFEIVVNETNEIASEHGQHFTVNNSSTEPWKDLALFWAEHPSIYPDIFYCALYHIAADVYPKGCQPSMLLSHVEDMILYHDSALSQWESTYTFADAHFRVDQSKVDSPFLHHWNSYFLRDIARCRFFLLTVLRLIPEYLDPSKEISPKVRHNFGFAQRAGNRFDDICYILDAIHPSAYAGGIDDCPTEDSIFKAIKSRCGVDFSNRPKDFDLLCHILRAKLLYKTYYRELFSFEDIPEDVIPLIWSSDEDLEKDLLTQFRWLCLAKPNMQNNAYDPNDVISPENVRNSWAFQHLWDMLHAGKVKLSNKARSNLLNMSVGNHPCIVREHQKANQPVA